MTPFGIHTDVIMHRALHCHCRITPILQFFFNSLCFKNKLIIFTLHNKRIWKPGQTNERVADDTRGKKVPVVPAPKYSLWPLCHSCGTLIFWVFLDFWISFLTMCRQNSRLCTKIFQFSRPRGTPVTVYFHHARELLNCLKNFSKSALLTLYIHEEKRTKNYASQQY